MTREWFCRTGGKQYGPMTLDQIKRMVAAGQLPLEATLRQGESEEWIPLSECPALLAPSAPAKGLARTAASLNAIPTGKPVVGTAVPPPHGAVAPAAPRAKASDSSAVIPVGSVVATPRAAAPVAPAAPKGKAVAPAAAVPKSRGASAARREEAEQQDAQPAFTVASPSPARKSYRSSSSMTMWLIIGGALLVVAGGGIGALVMQSNNKPTKAATVSAEPKAAKAVKKIEPTEEPAVEAVDPATALKSISKWKSSLNVTSKVAGIQIVSIWSGHADESQDATKAPDRLFVELIVTNSGSTPLVYNTWNGAAGKGVNAAILANQSDKISPLVSDAKLPAGLKRQIAPVKIAPGQNVTDCLVFEHPGKDLEQLKLALRFTAIGQGENYLGFKIAKDVVATERPKEAPPAVAKTNTAAPAATPAKGNDVLVDAAFAPSEPTKSPTEKPAMEKSATENPPPAKPAAEPVFNPKEFDKSVREVKERGEDGAKKTMEKPGEKSE